jgi:hypothetical protein
MIFSCFTLKEEECDLKGWTADVVRSLDLRSATAIAVALSVTGVYEKNGHILDYFQ